MARFFLDAIKYNNINTENYILQLVLQKYNLEEHWDWPS